MEDDQGNFHGFGCRLTDWNFNWQRIVSYCRNQTNGQLSESERSVSAFGDVSENIESNEKGFINKAARSFRNVVQNVCGNLSVLGLIEGTLTMAPENTKLEAVPDELRTLNGRLDSFQNSDTGDDIALALAELGFYYIGYGQIKNIDDSSVIEGQDFDKILWNRGPHTRGRIAERGHEHGRTHHRCLDVRRMSLSDLRREERRGSGYHAEELSLREPDPSRVRASSEPREAGHSRLCINCGQDPREEADEVVLQRSIDIQKGCRFCGTIGSCLEVCTPSQSYVCENEECQRQAAMEGLPCNKQKCF